MACSGVSKICGFCLTRSFGFPDWVKYPKGRASTTMTNKSALNLLLYMFLRLFSDVQSFQIRLSKSGLGRKCLSLRKQKEIFDHLPSIRVRYSLPEPGSNPSGINRKIIRIKLRSNLLIRNRYGVKLVSLEMNRRFLFPENARSFSGFTYGKRRILNFATFSEIMIIFT